MIGFKSFRCVCVILSGIEVVLMVRKGQLSGDYNRSAVA
jgi:putative transposase